MFDTDEAEESGAIALAGDPHAADHAAAAQRGPAAPIFFDTGLKRKASDDNGGASAAAPRPGAAVPKKGPAAKRSKHEDQSREKKRMLDEYLAMIKQVLLSTDTARGPGRKWGVHVFRVFCSRSFSAWHGILTQLFPADHQGSTRVKKIRQRRDQMNKQREKELPSRMKVCGVDS